MKPRNVANGKARRHRSPRMLKRVWDFNTPPKFYRIKLRNGKILEQFNKRVQGARMAMRWYAQENSGYDDILGVVEYELTPVRVIPKEDIIPNDLKESYKYNPTPEYIEVLETIAKESDEDINLISTDVT